ncbi:hypothetical protein UFOVP276_40 [uncultured Caudovirales phage]|uniref:Uncharacterized protein n=1 Tax=uncultured Caudovirales phage TaxID=2100421 RepID=A0A6J5LEV5_9CAUD|nr:hypothetical protein UFOVP127_177 [uncultured Caudovirales phage]CAB4134983.1 hypothetical protein UFOVP276_40 [uncultured Caudovirales phage]
MSNFSDWKPYERFVQEGMSDGKFLNAGFTLLCAGPPRLASMGGATSLGAATQSAVIDQLVYPIGVIQNVNLSHNRQFSRIFEVGSERSYFISGRTVGQMAISRILYHGPSLLRVLYAYYADTVAPYTMQALFPNVGVSSFANPHDVVIPPGYDNLFVNLASDLFNQPIGLMMYIKDSDQTTYGAVYLEGCYIPNHTWATDAQGVLIQESAAIQFERAVPVSVTNVTLTAGANAAAGVI